MELLMCWARVIFIIRIYSCQREQIIISESLDIWDVSIWKSSNMDIIWSCCLKESWMNICMILMRNAMRWWIGLWNRWRRNKVWRRSWRRKIRCYGGKMNNIIACAEGIVVRELVYVWFGAVERLPFCYMIYC